MRWDSVLEVTHHEARSRNVIFWHHRKCSVEVIRCSSGLVGTAINAVTWASTTRSRPRFARRCVSSTVLIPSRGRWHEGGTAWGLAFVNNNNETNKRKRFVDVVIEHDCEGCCFAGGKNKFCHAPATNDRCQRTCLHLNHLKRSMV